MRDKTTARPPNILFILAVPLFQPIPKFLGDSDAHRQGIGFSGAVNFQEFLYD
ncbi:hypothetical protein [Hydrogenophaga sp. BPS33]|uniref:hypothetical protein n=1 Tax=Hydrogenophaga sp. BPS33 TaxID=2651974 RepID=UPI0013577982|nr:hypothetical protein [Hydrogenophaga sp. BPS33]